MERIDLFDIYQLGARINPFLEIRGPNIRLYDLFFPLMNAMIAFDLLLGDTPPFHISVSRSAAIDARDSLSGISIRHFDGTSGFPKYPQTDETIEYLSIAHAQSSIRSFETVLRAESRRQATYAAPNRGTYDIGLLVDSAEKTFPDTIHPHIGILGLQEYNSAGRCYAFGLWTASGYHACRAVEAVLRNYYRVFVGDDAGKATWGELIAGLEKTSGKAKPQAKTIGQLKHVKDFERNPISHLRATLDESDADVLLSGTKVVITAMARELSRLEAETGPQLPFPDTPQKAAPESPQ